MKKQNKTKPLKRILKGFTKSELISGILEMNDKSLVEIRETFSARDYTLCCPCANSKDDDEPDECIPISLVVRFKNHAHWESEEDCGAYGGILENLNEALENGKGNYDREAYKDVETLWYVNDSGIDVEKMSLASESKVEPDVDLTK